jgi:hypothetical protein
MLGFLRDGNLRALLTYKSNFFSLYLEITYACLVVFISDSIYSLYFFIKNIDFLLSHFFSYEIKQITVKWFYFSVLDLYEEKKSKLDKIRWFYIKLRFLSINIDFFLSHHFSYEIKKRIETMVLFFRFRFILIKNEQTR